MKRIRKIVFFILFMILIIPFTAQKVYAADCSDVMAAVNRLDNIDNDYIALKCDEAVDTQTLYKCNKLVIERSSILEEIYEYNDENTCPSIDLSSIISDQKNNCSNRYSSKLKVVTDSVMKFFYIIAPFILLIFGSLDFFKIVVGTPEQIKKHRTNFIKRLVAFLLLYITPFIVETLFSVTPYNINGVKYICAEEISLNPNVTTATDAEGIYGGNNAGGAGQAIADKAKELIEYAHDNGFTYDCPRLGFNAFSSSNSRKVICCATLASIAIHDAEVEPNLESMFSKTGYSVDSSPGLAVVLDYLEWDLIKDKKELEPGDIVFFRRHSDCLSVSIRGAKPMCPGHVEVYAGDGLTYSAGKTSDIKNMIDYVDADEFAFAFRLPSKSKK